MVLHFKESWSLQVDLNNGSSPSQSGSLSSQWEAWNPLLENVSETRLRARQCLLTEQRQADHLTHRHLRG